MQRSPSDDASAVLAEVARELQRQLRWNGLALSFALLGLLLGIRWINEAPYAGNSLYFAVVMAVIIIRSADLQLLRAVSRLASVLAERERQGYTQRSE